MKSEDNKPKTFRYSVRMVAEIHLKTGEIDFRFKMQGMRGTRGERQRSRSMVIMQRKAITQAGR